MEVEHYQLLSCAEYTPFRDSHRTSTACFRKKKDKNHDRFWLRFAHEQVERIPDRSDVVILQNKGRIEKGQER
jgi:hypothetical protein